MRSTVSPTATAAETTPYKVDLAILSFSLCLVASFLFRGSRFTFLLLFVGYFLIRYFRALMLFSATNCVACSFGCFVLSVCLVCLVFAGIFFLVVFPCSVFFFCSLLFVRFLFFFVCLVLCRFFLFVWCCFVLSLCLVLLFCFLPGVVTYVCLSGLGSFFCSSGAFVLAVCLVLGLSVCMVLFRLSVWCCSVCLSFFFSFVCLSVWCCFVLSVCLVLFRLSVLLL